MIQRSPSSVTGSSSLSISSGSKSSSLTSVASSSIRDASSAIASKSKPKPSIPMLRPSSSFSRSGKSHSASSPVLLSASLKALTCSGVRSSATMHGTRSSPSLWAALYLVWPATIVPSLSMTIGTLNPNSRMLLATASTACSFFLGFLSYGWISSSAFSYISISLSFPGMIHRRVCRCLAGSLVPQILAPSPA